LNSDQRSSVLWYGMPIIQTFAELDALTTSSNYVEVSKSPFISLNAEILLNWDSDRLSRIEIFLLRDSQVTLRVN
jgi:hypothetical protein